MIVKKEVEHIAKLARISLTEKEKIKYQKEFSLILDFFEELKEVEIRGVLPTFYPIIFENITRKDEAKAKNKKLIGQAVMREDNFFKVKSVF